MTTAISQLDAWWLIDLLVRTTALLSVAALVATLLRSRSAAVRHMVWLLALLLSAALPLAAAVSPAWEVLPQWSAPAVPASPPVVNDFSLPGQDVAAIGAIDRPARPGSVNGPWLIIGYCVVAVLTAAPLLLGQLSLWRLGRQSRRAPELADALADAAATLNLPADAVQLRLSDQRAMPMTWGVFRPRILLPSQALQWSGDRLGGVLLHELAHVQRRDVLTQMLAHLACAAVWINPLAWYARQRQLMEQERAADDVVLSAGCRSDAYAEHVLEIAHGASHPRLTGPAAIAMARTSRLEGRLLAILDARRRRGRVTLAAMGLAAGLALMVALPVAVLRAQPGRLEATPAEVAQTVQHAVEVVSMSREGDPVVRQQLDALKPLPAAQAIAELDQHLDSVAATERRAAIYLLWHGPWDQLPQDTVDRLIQLTQHSEGVTRGMAALALGAKKAVPSLDVLSDLTLNDDDSYVRRAAAYALGLLGDPAAQPVLEQSMQDPDPLVQSNARTALKMLSQTDARLVQSQVYDLQPDGTIRFKSGMSFANDTDEALTTVQFMNSDFVQVKRALDEQGRVLPMHVEHRDSDKTYHYRIELVDPALPGQEVKLLTEGEMQGLVKPLGDGRMLYQMRHHPATQAPVRRIETHLLPKGAVLLESDNVEVLDAPADQPEIAGRTILRVDETVPPGGNVFVRYIYRLDSAR